MIYKRDFIGEKKTDIQLFSEMKALHLAKKCSAMEMGGIFFCIPIFLFIPFFALFLFLLTTNIAYRFGKCTKTKTKKGQMK